MPAVPRPKATVPGPDFPADTLQTDSERGISQG